MKSLSTALKAAVSSGSTSLCYIVAITLWNGQQFFFTDSDKDVVVGSTTFRSDLGCSVSQLRWVLGTSAQSCAINTFIDDTGITSQMIDRGAIDDARVQVDIVDWSDTSLGTIKCFLGFVAKASYQDRWTCALDCQPLLSRDKTLADEVFSSNCRTDFGDARCKVDIDALKVTTAVTASPTRQSFSTGDGSADNHWQTGLAAFTSGANAGISVEIAASDHTGSIVLRGILPYVPAIGDSVTLYPGCDKTPARCHDYGNMVNFRGEPFAVAPWIVSSTVVSNPAPTTNVAAPVETPMAPALPELSPFVVNLVEGQ